MGLLDEPQHNRLLGLLGPSSGSYDPHSENMLARNKQYAKPAKSYLTNLPPLLEHQFQQWAQANKIPFDPSPRADYDMRGFYTALINKDPRATTAQNSNDGRLHFPDAWKTPYHQSFSNESLWALPNAPRWNEHDQLVDSSGRVIYDERRRNALADLLFKK